MPDDRTILHVDMDAFFASVEQRDRPDLRGRPVLVGGRGPRGVVAAASYEARVHGCHSAQPMRVALRRCPEAVVLPPDGARYRAASEQVFSFFRDLTPQVEPLSVDEAFLDLTGSERLLGAPVEVARALKQRIRDEVGLTASVGVAGNKFLAKLASDLEKPDGLTVIEAARVREVLAPLPVERIPGVGPATGARLRERDVRTIGDLHAWTLEDLQRTFGNVGASLWQRARGLDDRPVVPDGRARSLSQERTFPVDVEDAAYVRDVLRAQGEHVARRLRAAGLVARTVGVKIRYGDFETITRRQTLERPTDVTQTVLEAACRLFDRWARRGYRPVRLIGVGVSNLDTASGEQLGLFEEPTARRQKRLDAALDAIQDRFGGRSIGRGAGAVPERGDGDVPDTPR